MSEAMIERVAVPPSPSLAAAVPFDDYRDAFRIAVEPGAFPDVDAFARAFVRSPPVFARALMGLRDAIAGAFALKRIADAPAPDDAAPLVPGARLGIFRVFRRTEHELLLGEDDRHLDFRVSVLHEGDAVVVSTMVRFHNALGRAYFLPVAPMHRLVVPAMMRRALSRPRATASRT